MPKKQKHPNLPNGYGSIRRLSGNRTNPYAVHPPVTDYTDRGIPITPRALCYVADWYVGFAVLTAYKAGTYTPGMEQELAKMRAVDDGDLSLFTKNILANLQVLRNDPEEQVMTFSELYKEYFHWKYEGKKKYSQSSIDGSRKGFRNCSAIHNKKITDITYQMMQDILDSCPLKHSSLEFMLSCMKQCFHYAYAQGYIEKNPTELLRINIPEDDEHGVPFTEKDLSTLWDHEEDDIAQHLLIMCYSGLRVNELKVVTVDLDNFSFSGGLKTPSGKNRINPIHSSIQNIVSERLKKYGCLMPNSYSYLNKNMNSYLPSLGIEAHTPHDCKHTFSMLCEKYGVRENDRKRMLGHKFSDVTNDVYGHRALEDLRTEIEKIPCCKRVANEPLIFQNNPI